MTHRNPTKDKSSEAGRQISPVAQHRPGFGGEAVAVAVMRCSVMQDHRRQQPERRPPPLAGPQNHPACGAVQPGCQRKNRQRAKPPVTCGQHVGQTRGKVDQRQPAAGGKTARGGIDPDGKGRVFALGGLAARIVGGRAIARGKKGRVGTSSIAW